MLAQSLCMREHRNIPLSAAKRVNAFLVSQWHSPLSIVPGDDKGGISRPRICLTFWAVTWVGNKSNKACCSTKGSSTLDLGTGKRGQFRKTCLNSLKQSLTLHLHPLRMLLLLPFLQNVLIDPGPA